jgi:hypothetical protein
MRVLIALLLLTSTVRAADEAHTIIDKAIQAVGGEAKLPQAKAFSQKVSGTLFSPAGAVTFTAERVVNFPNQLRETADADSKGEKFQAIKVIAGDKGWLRIGDSLRELDKDTLAGEQQQMYVAYLTTLLPLK